MYTSKLSYIRFYTDYIKKCTTLFFIIHETVSAINQCMISSDTSLGEKDKSTALNTYTICKWTWILACKIVFLTFFCHAIWRLTWLTMFTRSNVYYWHTCSVKFGLASCLFRSVFKFDALEMCKSLPSCREQDFDSGCFSVDLNPDNWTMKSLENYFGKLWNKPESQKS